MEKILIVDDHPKTRGMLRRHLTRAGYDTLEVENGTSALEAIRRDLPDVVLLDVMMPGITGFEVCQQLLSMPQHNLMYIIMLSAISNSEQKVEGLDKGADDYMTKPFDIEELLARIRVGIRTVKKKRDAIIDPLTSLYNRHFFNKCLKREVDRIQRYQRQLSLIVGDIDYFKQVNDTYGHLVGDTVLVTVSEIIRQHCRQSDLPVRWGGEEFAILLPETGLAGSVVVAERIRAAIEQTLFKTVQHVTISFGVATFLSDEQDLLQRADSALYQAKGQGRNQVVTQ